MSLKPAYGANGGPGGGGVTDHGALTGLAGEAHADIFHNVTRAATWLAAGHSTTYDHPSYDAHLADATLHRLINDAGVTATELYSAERILALIAGLAPTGHTHPTLDPIMQALPVAKSGEYYALHANGSTAGNIAGAAGRIDVVPFCPGHDLEISAVRLEVTTGVASDAARVVLYSSAASGGPSALIWASTDMDVGISSGFVSASKSYVFARGVQVWLGVHWGSTTTLRADQMGACAVFGSMSDATRGPVIARATGQTFASGAPSTFPAPSRESVNAVRVELLSV